MREKCKQLLRWNYFPFVCLAACLLLYHLFMQVGGGDDAYLVEALHQYSMPDYLIHFYMTWQARTISIFFMEIFVSIPHIFWRLADTLIILGMAWTLSILFTERGQSNKKLNWFITGSLLIYPWSHMFSAGWIATTTCYSWVLAFLLIAMIPLKKQCENQSLKAWEYPLYVVAGIIAGSQEQSAAMLFFIYLVVTVYLVVTHKKKCIFLWIQMILSVASLAYIFVCPGNKLRAAAEQITWFPNFSMLSPFQQADQGTSRALCQIFFTPNVTALVVCILAAILVFHKYNDVFYRVISLFPLAVLVIMGFLTPITQTIFPGVAKMLQQTTLVFRGTVTDYGMINFDNFTFVYGYLTFFILSMAFVCILVSIFLIFGGKEKSFILCIALIGSLAVTAVLGFSPTIWSSSNRTFIFLYFTFIIYGISLYKESALVVTKVGKMYYRTGYSIVVVLCYLNTLMLVLS